MKPLIRSLAAEVRILDAKQRTADFIASDETLDCYGEIVRAAGWKFDRFAKNAPFVDSHDYSSVGRLLGNVIAWRVQGRSLIETVQFVPEGASALADFAWKMSEAGFLKAVSVGFMPIRVRSRWRDESDFAEAVKELGLDGEMAAKLNAIHWEQDQTELSSVLIGANPSAVALAHKRGAVSDEDLSRVGFRTAEDVSFLHEAARGWDNADAMLRRNIRLALRGMTAPENFPSGTHGGATRAAHSGPGNEAHAEAKHETRNALLGELRKLDAATASACEQR